jgi:PAS domain S-box-containing protein
MVRSQLWQRRGFPLAIAAVTILVVLAVFADLRRRDAAIAGQRQLGRQTALAGQAAHRLEESLLRLQKGLAHLAGQPPGAGGLPRGTRTGLELLSHEYPAPLLKALFLQDAGGQLRAEYPAGALAENSFPRRLLFPAAHPSTAPRLVSEEEPPLLLLHQPLPSGSRPAGELGALVNLRQVVSNALADLVGQANFGFLVDARGRFLLHCDPSWDGKPATALAAPAQEAALLDLLKQAGRKPVPEVPEALAGLLLPLSPASAENGPMLSLMPLQVGGSRWVLGLAFPSAGSTSILPSPAWFSPLLLCCAAAVGALGWRLRHQERHRQQLAGTCGELTRRLEQNQATLELATRRYQHLLDHAGDALFFINPADGSLQKLNRQAQELLGYQPEEIHNLSLGVLFPGQQRRRFLRLVHNVRCQGYAESDDLLFRRKDGSFFIGAVHARLGHLGDEEVVHGVLRDVSERKRIEQELRQRNQDLTLLNEISLLAADSSDLPGMLDSILRQLVDNFSASGGGIYLARDSATRLQLEAHCGIIPPILDLLGQIPSTTGVVGRVMASGQPKASADLQRDRRVHFEAVRQAGWCGYQAVPLSANDQTVGVFFLFSGKTHLYSRDQVSLLVAIGRQLGTAVQGANLFDALQWQNRLTQASNRELELSRQKLRETLGRVTESKRTLEHLERMKSQFLALASHELRTPLTYILSGSEILTERLAPLLDAEAQTALAAVQQGGQRLNDVVRDLLEVARIEAQDLYLSRETVDPRDLLGLLGEEFRGRLLERQLQLAVSGFPDSVRLYGDRHHLKKTFGRLLENALKFTPEGGRIEISGRLQSRAQILTRQEQLRPFSPRFFSNPAPGPLLQVSIRDTGVGIDADEQLRIFAKFYEIGEVAGHFTSTSRFGGKGVGLGLALVKGIVEAHGGMVWVESTGTAGGQAGSAFHLLLPAARGDTGSASLLATGEDG